MLGVLRIAFKVLAVFAALLWVAAYVYVLSLACIFGNPSAVCRVQFPWELRGQDLTYLVLIPAGIVASLMALSWGFAAAGQRRASGEI